MIRTFCEQLLRHSGLYCEIPLFLGNKQNNFTFYCFSGVAAVGIVAKPTFNPWRFVFGKAPDIDWSQMVEPKIHNKIGYVFVNTEFI